MRELIELTWKEIEAIDKERAVVCVTVAPIEEHSYHLPVGTDIFEGEYWLKGMARRIENKYEVFHLLPVTVASASAGYPYSIHFKPKITQEVVYEMMSGISKMGFKNIVIIASHGDPIHHVAIERACDKINSEAGVMAFSPLGAFFSLDHNGIDFEIPPDLVEFEREFNDIHAGFIETSSMLDIDESIVKGSFKDLPDTHILDKDMSSGEKILAAMDKFGHLGAPRLAKKEMGEELNENTIDYLEQSVKAFLEKKDYEKYMHHFLYNMPFMKYAFMDK